MKIIAISHDLNNPAPEDFMPHLKAESLRVWELMQADILREIYFRQDRHDAVLILECAGADEANAVIQSLPLVKAGLIAFDLLPLVPYPGLGRLFAP